MVCYRPLTAYRLPGGGISFDDRACYSRRIELPCGQCVGCRLANARAWMIRCWHEASLQDENCFITLTYDNEHLPKDGSLDVGEWQRFAKRLRKRCGPFRFFHCGEYGDKGDRPHYHALLFGLDFSADRQVFRRGRMPLWTSAVLDDVWGLGFSTVGGLTKESAGYVARYCLKKLTGPKGAEVYGERKAPYATMSRGGRGGKGGIGSEWLKKFHTDVFPSDEVVVDGKVFRPPRFYDEKLSEEELELLKRKRRRRLKVENVSEERLRVREKVAQARSALKRREL